MEIVCSSFITACESLSSWFQCNNVALEQFLCKDWAIKYEQSRLSYKMNLGEYLYLHALKVFTPTKATVKIHWFHGTRSMIPASFENGILPLQDILPNLQKSLDELAESHGISQVTMISEAHRHYEFLINTKKHSDIDKGPCAMLNLDAVINAASYTCHNYIDMPEIIEDYAHVKYGDCSVELLELYREAASPIIVEFWTAPDDPYNPNIKHIVSTILFYLYKVIHSEQDRMGLYCNTCYSGHGNKITSEQILKVFKI